MWDVTIGLEVHTQLNTQSKIFSSASTQYGGKPNTQISSVDVGLPGSLPVLNQEVIRKTIRFGLAINGNINQYNVFDRKNYFYPDLPKGYQISQFHEPIITNGFLTIQDENDKSQQISIVRAHLEEDAGKSDHEAFAEWTGIDFNRAGTPLLEIVSEPAIHSAEQAVAYLKKLHQLVCHMDISDGQMQEGSFRCDVNLSLKPEGSQQLGTRTEIKNINSFRFVEQAINYEINRQSDILESNGQIVQETRLYDPDKGQTRTMRSKEEAHDYRYFPDPDLLPVVIDKAFIQQVKDDMPELPEQMAKRLMNDYNLNNNEAQILVNNKALANYFEKVVAQCQNAKLAANWVLVELNGYLNKHQLTVEQMHIQASSIAQLINRIQDGTISGKIAKQVFEALQNDEGSVDAIIDKKGLKQITDTSEIEDIIDQILKDNPKQLEQLKNGKTKLIGFFVGQVMKKTQGKANPQKVNELIKYQVGID